MIEFHEEREAALRNAGIWRLFERGAYGSSPRIVPVLEKGETIGDRIDSYSEDLATFADVLTDHIEPNALAVDTPFPEKNLPEDFENVEALRILRSISRP